MKILITTDLFSTATNGVVTSVKNLVEELQAKGHEVRVLTLSESTRSHKDGYVYFIPSAPLKVYPDVRMPLSYHHRLIRELIDWRPQVIHSQCEFFTFQFALRISRHTGAPIVHTYHTLYEQYAGYVLPGKRLGAFVVRTFSRKRLKKVETVIAPTHKVENTLVGYGMENAIAVIPSGISLAQHKKRITPQQRQEKRQALGIGPDETVLINLGRLGTEKNLPELVDFYARALARHPKLRFLIVGDGPARQELEEMARQRGLAERIIFTGMVNPAQVQEYYQLGDIFVSASTSETQGLTYIEAAANGLPLLCRQDLCLEDVLRHGENGYSYTNAEEFLQSIDAILQDKAWLEQAGQRSAEIAAGFDKNAFGNAVEEVYQSVVTQ